MIKQVIYSVLLILFSSVGFSNTLFIDGIPVDIGPVVSSGPGCPEGTITVIVYGDNDKVNLLLNSYSAVTNSTDTSVFKDCDFTVPMSVPSGYSVGIINYRWQGSVVTAPGAFVNFHGEYFFGGPQSQSDDANWFESGFEYFVLEGRPDHVNYSDCNGGEYIFEANTAVAVIGPNSLISFRPLGFVSLAPLDLEGLYLDLDVRPC
jgi:Domain of unknown function (DUF4360)